MELSERCIVQLEKENWPHIYEWQDKPNVVYPEHVHQGAVTLLVTDGSVDITIHGSTCTLRIGDRFDIPSKTLHSAVVGPSGCQFVVGEEISGDS